jgi:LysR family transcriptional regulator, carnitine catabolism transcriptional activator
MSNLAMVEAGLGVTILPRLCRWKCGYAVRFMPLADQRASRTVGWVAKAGRALQPAARQFLECVRRQTRDGAKEFGYAAL